MMNIRTNLKELNSLDPAPFSEELIVCESEYLQSKGIFLYPDFDTSVESVPLNKVIGHNQIYDEMKWGDCLNGHYLKRIDYRLDELSKNPNYYLSDKKKEGVSFRKIGDEYFIATGKHRCVIARFLEFYNPEVFESQSALANVTVYHYRIDHDFMSLKAGIDSLVDRYPTLMFNLNYTSNIDEYCLTIHTKNYVGIGQSYKRNELSSLITDFNNPSVLRKFSSDKNHRFIPFSECFKSLFN